MKKRQGISLHIGHANSQQWVPKRPLFSTKMKVSFAKDIPILHHKSIAIPAAVFPAFCNHCCNKFCHVPPWSQHRHSNTLVQTSCVCLQPYRNNPKGLTCSMITTQSYSLLPPWGVLLLTATTGYGLFSTRLKKYEHNSTTFLVQTKIYWVEDW